MLGDRPTLRRAYEWMGRGGVAEAVPLDDSAAAWAARWRLMANATRSIDASYFIVENDVIGMAFVAHLYQRARAGVGVRLVMDGRGSAPFALPFLGLDEMQELVGTGNADVRVYNPPALQIPRTLLERSAVPVSAGMHAKILIADDEIAIAGGRNIGAVYFAKRGEVDGAVVDSDVLLRGPAVVEALDAAVHHELARWGQESVRRDAVNIQSQDEFLRMIYFAMDAWLRGAIPNLPPARAGESAVLLEAAALAHFVPQPSLETRERVRPYLATLARMRSLRGALSTPQPGADVVEARVVTALGRADDEEHLVDESANDALVRAIASARSRVWIESPYFMLTPRLFGALSRASARGVEIVVLTNGPGSSDNEASQALFIDSWPELQAAMPTLRVFVGARQMLHTKRVIVDDVLTLVGSHNLDPLSAHLNSEVVVALWSLAMNDHASSLFRAALDGGEVLEYRIRRVGGVAERDVDGNVVVEFGPNDHLTPQRLEELRALKRFLFSIRGIWDFEFVVW